MAVITGTAGADVLTGGPGNDIIFGLNGNNTIDGGGGADILNGGTGNDTYYVDVSGDVITDTGGLHDLVHVSALSYVVGAGIETIIMDAGSVSLIANSANNIITGNNAGNSIGGLGGNDAITGGNLADTLDGGAGSDTLTGGTGNDTYIVDSATDKIFEGGADAADLVLASTTYTLSANLENITLIGTLAASATGNAGNNALTGNTSNNVLRGMDGNDVLDGGVGVDQMYGGNGDDTYFVDNSRDRIVEVALGGTDSVSSTASYTLSAEVENLTLLGSGAFSGIGNASANTITGNIGNNILDGGAGADSLVDGGGDDTYVVDNIGDVILDSGGTDTVKSSITVDVATNPNFAGIENITLTGTAAINATGDGGVNIINGASNTAANILTGGAGDDTYFADIHDVIVESPGNGNDTMEVLFSFNLLTSTATVGSVNTGMTVSNVENVTLLGTAALNATGDNNANILTGNTAINKLFGLDGNDVIDGGKGADSMVGGLGSDTFYVNDSKDVVIEANTGGADVDLVISAVSYNLNTAAPTTLGAQEIEKLTLATGLANINGTGNGLANVITGNDGNNTLDGGLGADSLLGGLGNDVFIVDDPGDTVTELGGQGTDIILSGVSIGALAANVENLTLTGTLALNATGNGLENVITGNSAANSLDGAGGNDTYVIGINDTVNDTGSELSDTIKVGFTFNLATSMATVAGVDTVMSVAGIENITLTGTTAINATGDFRDNILTGNSAVNTFDGGDGNDTYVVGANDVILTDSNGVDTVISGVTYSLAAHGDLENLKLSGAGSINATGNSLDNSLFGNTGNNILNGGAGNDVMVGGLGNDTYVVDAPGDTVAEDFFTNEGIDTVQSGVNFLLDNGNLKFIENVTLTGSTALVASGNDLENVITGNGLANTLSGGLGNDTIFGGNGDDTIFGEGGSDVMNGGNGNDLYFVDSTADIINDITGIDIVSSSATYTLSTGLDHLTLTGSADIDGTGNEIGNIITGNDGNNILSGLGGNDILIGGLGDDTLNGGIGDDTMFGGVGNDTFFIDSTHDQFVENAAEGNLDVIETVFNVTLMPQNIEGVVLLDQAPAGQTLITAKIATGDANANLLVGNSLDNTLTGNGGSDTLIGNSGNDTLDGGAGNDILAGDGGNDTITGGAGADFFVLTNAGDHTIKDFSIAQGDQLFVGDILDPNFYTPGVSNINDFVVLTTASGSTHVFVDVDGPTQADGTGATPFVEVAVLKDIVGLDVSNMLTNGNLVDLPLSLGI